MGQEFNVKKCANCGEYTDSSLELCSHCGFEIHAERRAEINKRRQIEDIHIPIWKIHKTDPIWLKITKRPVQFVQLLLYGIVAFFIYLSTSLAH